MKAFTSLYEILDHIKDVEEETIELSKNANIKITAFLEKNSLELDDDVIDALQYQDIISQQLSATIEAIVYVKSHLKMFEASFDNDASMVNESADKLHDKLNKALEKARDKRNAFSGKTGDSDNTEDEIEFF